MGIRFRKSIRVAPGVRLNLGKKSVGVSMGGKYGGMSVNSKTGARTRISAPGTGLSYTSQVGGKHIKSTTLAETNPVDNPSDSRFHLFLDAKALASLDDDAFLEYSRMVIDAGKAIDINDDPDEIQALRDQLSLIRAESENRMGKNRRKDISGDRWALLIMTVVFMTMAVLCAAAELSSVICIGIFALSVLCGVAALVAFFRYWAKGDDEEKQNLE